ncbi:MAG: hypothetical protein HN726_03155 [Candidatus Magasanikbacteria bacterium]|jgi:hypothetical protein|nr:hypothetical protein [Candidatus Magasanikbacteria bacterium]MBT4221040.1 hypothetical protein [Candidatus Magasanikbacteria bacterium]MBT4350616.1 hypothetical protein [Candidatus Magasanikbacteria bacterium]MBT4542085.1 hypothetical protein [Candidatus Magasanikbacteria bacterium]MBT6253601.1 hypothetical protein [Candidatus Magasanikbacteria bacterium]
MKRLSTKLNQTPVVYVTRDIERALGLPDTEGYFIISNATEFAKEVAKNRAHILLIEEETILDTWQLLEHDKTNTFLKTLSSQRIVVFKNTPHIERICASKQYNLLNPAADLALTVEAKISQVSWLGDLATYLPPSEILLGKDLTYAGTPFIVQFNRTHTGGGTMLIESEDDLISIKERFPNREVRKSTYIEGYTITSNNVVSTSDTFIGNISYQITGLSPFTSQPFATIGNDWALPPNILTEKQLELYTTMVNAIGMKLKGAGWKGLFGVDALVSSKDGAIYLIEINARQPASTTFESVLQEDSGSVTMFALHLAALLDIDSSSMSRASLSSGAQIILRQKEEPLSSETVMQYKDTLIEAGYTVMSYPGTKPGTDLLRIQTETSLMDAHNVFSPKGNQIIDILSL